MVPTEVGTRCRTCVPPPAKRLASSASSGSALPGNFAYYVYGAVAVAAAAALAYGLIHRQYDRVIIASIVIGGSLVSTVIHEFCHGLVAYYGGDRSIRERGMLTFNPTKYIDPLYSVIMPLFMVLRGGLPLVGGRTLIHTHSLRSKEWQTAVSLAGPASNLAIAIIISLVLNTGLLSDYFAVEAGFAYLAQLQVAFCLFNLIPIPPFDGYGALEPHLPLDIQAKARSIGSMGYFIVFIGFAVFPELSNQFWEQAYLVGDWIRIPIEPSFWGWALTQLNR